MIVACVGTRPDFIKMAPVIAQLEAQKIPHKILHTGQHYSPELAGIYKELGLRDPDCHIQGIEKYTTPGSRMAFLIQMVEPLLQSWQPNMVLVYGDTDHALACALAARKRNIPIGHVEAGLRSHDWRQPEEHNRRIIDHISEYLFAPTLQNVMNLAQEHVGGVVYLMGNTICDILPRFLPINRLEMPLKPYILLTVHRSETLEDPDAMRRLVEATWSLKDELGMPITFPCHPYTRAKLKEYELLSEIESNVQLTPPMGYSDFLKTLNNSAIVLTDSGGVQEEACILKVPCVVLRDCTDRPESIQIGAAMVSGLDPVKILDCTRKMLEANRNWPNVFNPFDDNKCAERIVSLLGETR